MTIVKCPNLTVAGYIAIRSDAGKKQFLNDRQRSVNSRMQKAINEGLRAGDPRVDGLIRESQLILSLQKVIHNKAMKGPKEYDHDAAVVIIR